MKTYIFASRFGSDKDFIIEGHSPGDAWEELCVREKSTGRLWEALDFYTNSCAIQAEGFHWLMGKANCAVYKEV
jgi:hypothetical protein